MSKNKLCSIDKRGKETDTAYLPVCFSISSIFVWKTWSTASTLTPVPLCGMAKTSTTRTVYSSTKSPSISPITSIGTPALPAHKTHLTPHFNNATQTVTFVWTHPSTIDNTSVSWQNRSSDRYSCYHSTKPQNKTSRLCFPTELKNYNSLTNQVSKILKVWGNEPSGSRPRQ